MAKIDVYTNEMSSLSARLKKVSSVIENAEQVTGRVQSSLDFQVAAKADIAGALSRTRKQLQQQKDKVVKMANLTTASSAEFRDADSQMDKSARNVLGKIAAPVAGMVLGVKDLFRLIPVKQYQSINSIFMPAGTIITVAGVKELIRRLAQIVNGWKQNAGSTVVTGGVSSAAVDSGASTAPIEVKAYENLVSFSSDRYVGKTKGNYSDYSILGGMNPEYCYNQKNYNDWFKKNGCLACADACIGSIVGERALNPQEIWKGVCNYTTRIGIYTKDDSCKWTPEQIRARAYQELTQGKPVIVRVQSTSSEAGGHSVAVVGLRNGADPNCLTDADFLVMDPADGTIKSLGEMKKVSNSDTCLKPAQDNAGMRRVK